MFANVLVLESELVGILDLSRVSVSRAQAEHQHRAGLDGHAKTDANANAFTQSMTGHITSI